MLSTPSIRPSRLPLRLHAWLPFFLAAAGISGCGWILFQSQKRVQTAPRNLLAAPASAAQAAQSTKESLINYSNAVFQYVATKDTDPSRDLNRWRQSALSNLNQVKTLMPRQVGAPSPDALQAEAALFFADTNDLLRFSDTNQLPKKSGLFRAASWARQQPDQRQNLALLSLKAQSHLIRSLSFLDEFLALGRANAAQAKAAIDEQNERSVRTVMGLGALTLILVLAATVRIARVISRLKRVAEQTSTIVPDTTTDVLTQALSASYFSTRLRQEYDRSQRYHHALTLLTANVDHFQAYNQKHGQREGDVALQRMSALIRSHIRHIDIVGRTDGDEFSILLPHTKPEQSTLIAARLMAIMQGAHFPENDDQGDRLTLSIGGASVPRDVHSIADLVNKSREALRLAKQEGRGRLSWTNGPAALGYH